MGDVAKIISMASRRRSDRHPPPAEGESDDELMLLARGGAADAFEALVRRHQDRALRIAARYVGDAAGDVVQEAFLDIYRALPRYRAQGKFLAYLHRVLLNQCRMAFRADGSRNSALRRASTDVEPPAGTARDLILREERRKDVDRAVRRLGRKVREVVILRFAGELSYQEIAEVLAIPLGTVKSRLFFGLRKLARDLDREER